MRILALDLGTKSLGIAISDETNTIPLPLENYNFDVMDIKKPLERVLNLLKEYPINLILIGYSLKTNGKESNINLFIIKFINLLNKKTNIKIKKVDERYSTKRGEEMMLQNSKNLKHIKELKDVAAAYIILKDYLSFV